jgi:hypothetical protein
MQYHVPQSLHVYKTLASYFLLPTSDFLLPTADLCPLITNPAPVRLPGPSYSSFAEALFLFVVTVLVFGPLLFD